ncbi:putative bifunctional diguanylate cyclase/phosphodiesterase [Persephonella sp.]
MRKRIDFENLRKEIASKSGTVIENILRDISLLKGLRYNLKNDLFESSTKNETFDLILNKFENLLSSNIDLVKEGSIKALNLISLLEREVIDKKLLEKETKILKKIVLSRENIMDWKGYAKEILRDLKSVYPYDVFFFMFEEESIIKIYIFYSYVLSDERKESVKQFLVNKLKENFKGKFVNNKITKVEEIFITNKVRSKNFKNIHIETNVFLPDSPEIGGVLGLVILLEDKLPRKDINVLNSLLSIMTLVAGSSRALSKAITELEYFAGHDPLTELYNRRTFEDFLRYEVSRAKRKKHRFSLILIDLDNFKYINDTYGHHVGDIVLKSVADILESSVREGDLVARIGGDEFVILLSETDLKTAYKIAERLRLNLENNKICTFEGVVISVNASFGVVEYPTHGTNKEELMMIVDNALYKAKDLGKNIVYVPSPEEIEKTMKEKRREFYILQESIEKDLFIPYFQPIIDLSNDKTHAYEVLARLKGNNGEIISAYKFISLAEKIGKIKDIDKAIIKKALEKKVEKNIKEKLFLNLSAKDISDNDFWDYIFSVIKELNIKSDDIVFELTEREAVKEISEIQSLILKLKNKGYGFAIDDFGSGYSSFYYLKYFPIDYVKIDGEFIRELSSSDSKSVAFVESMNLLCKRLNIKTVAESIENKETLNLLKTIGIDFGQGYFLGIPESDFL